MALAGCGSTHATTPQALALERADLVDVARALAAQEPSVRREVAATKAAWPLVANGLPARADEKSARSAIRAAAERAAAVALPGIFQERTAASLTGPGSPLAGAFRGFRTVSARSWLLIGSALEASEHGSPAGARFARENVALYIDSVYDAHFAIAQVGKQLAAGYKRLGGATGFGASLTPAEVDTLADFYSEANERLHPHAGVKLGS